MSQEIDCPQCRTINTVPDVAIGSYFTCKNCKCLFWITVPPLGEATRPALRETPHEGRAVVADESTQDLDPTSKTLMRQEALLFTIVQEMKSLRRAFLLLAIGAFVMLIAAVAVCVALLK